VETMELDELDGAAVEAWPAEYTFAGKDVTSA
jgi:hypothetical protein